MIEVNRSCAERCSLMKKSTKTKVVVREESCEDDEDEDEFLTDAQKGLLTYDSRQQSDDFSLRRNAIYAHILQIWQTNKQWLF